VKDEQLVYGPTEQLRPQQREVLLEDVGIFNRQMARRAGIRGGRQNPTMAVPKSKRKRR